MGYLKQNSPSHYFKMGKFIIIFTSYYNLFIHNKCVTVKISHDSGFDQKYHNIVKNNEMKIQVILNHFC
jgi:hypothetical protein